MEGGRGHSVAGALGSIFIPKLLEAKEASADLAEKIEQTASAAEKSP